MARNRMLNPEFWLDEEIARLSAFARLLYMGLWGICDDNYATLPDRPDWIKAQIFPYEEVDTVKLLKELASAGKIIKFPAENKEFWYLKNFFKHQRVDRPSTPKYAPYPGALDEHSTSTRSEVKLSKVKLSKVNMTMFESFWSKYPRKIARKKAEQAFSKVNPDKKTLELILAAIEEQSKSPQWKKDDGQFIPHPATWLNQERWNDDTKIGNAAKSKYDGIKSTKVS